MRADHLRAFNIHWFDTNPTHLYKDEEDDYDYLSKDPNAQDKYGNTVVHKFILNYESEDPDVFELIQIVINKGADLEIRNCSGKTAFLLAAVHRDERMIEKLIENGANVFAQDNMGNNALHYIALPELDYLFESFIENPFQEIKDEDEFDLNFVDGFSILERLLKEGVDVNSTNHRHETPLMWAARGHRLKIVKMFLQYGANVHLQSEKSETCLHLASTPNPMNDIHWQESNSDIMSELILNKACVNCFDEKNRTPLCRILRSRHVNRNYFAREFIKAAALANWRREMVFNITERQLLEAFASDSLLTYVETCYNEIARMRNVQLSEATDLCQFARRDVSKMEESIASEVSNEALCILVEETFPEYHDFILFNFQISYLRLKLMEMDIYTLSGGQKVSLVPDLIFRIASFLEIGDLFSVFKAFWTKTTV